MCGTFEAAPSLPLLWMGPAYIKSKLPPSFTASPELRPNDAFEKLAINFAELLERSIDAFSNASFKAIPNVS